MTDMPDLLPCPFCGEMPEVENISGVLISCSCKLEPGVYGDIDKATTLWNTRAAPRWIPVTERLPEKVGDYLVRIDDNLRPNRAIKILPYFHSHGWMSESKQFPVTHWMPLPQPPKEVE